jgi:hypothetical protein
MMTLQERGNASFWLFPIFVNTEIKQQYCCIAFEGSCYTAENFSEVTMGETAAINFGVRDGLFSALHFESCRERAINRL